MRRQIELDKVGGMSVAVDSAEERAEMESELRRRDAFAPRALRVVPDAEIQDRVRVDRQTIAPRTVKRRLILADAVATMVGVGVTFAAQAMFAPPGAATVRGEWLLVVGSAGFWVFAAFATNLYSGRRNTRSGEEVKNIFMATSFAMLSTMAIAFIANFDNLPRRWIVTMWVSVVVALVIERRIARTVFRRLRTTGRLSRPVLMVGNDTNALALARTVQDNPGLGYRVVGFVGADPEPADQLGVATLGDLSRVVDVAAEVGATGVLVSLYSIDAYTVNRLGRQLSEAGLHVTLSTSLRDIDPSRLNVQEFDGRLMLDVEPIVRTGWRRVAMRVFDHTVAITGLVLTAPLMLVAAIAVKLDSKGPVFFRQVRTGVNGQLFEMIKFRTMCDGADAMKYELAEQNESDGPLFKMRSDPRVTRVGSILRKLSIDELPQFWNVLRGDMSVVGPRPALPSEVALWEDDVHERLRVLPGITGLWQVSGRADTTFEEYKRLDMYYVDNWSLRHDLVIVARTIGVVLARRGAS